MKILKLHTKTLSQLPEDVAVPKYDRTTIETGIVHVGVGGFHRAHQAYYIDQLLHDKANKSWGICGVSLLPSDAKIYNALQEQDGLYTLIVKELDGSLTTRVIGSIVEHLFAPENKDAVIQKMASETTKIISLTITEGGYNYNEGTEKFDFESASIQYDLKNATTPKTIFGYLTQALKLRKERGLSGCTIQSCDNIQGNGHFTKKMLLSFVQVAEPELVGWIENNISFPNSMVDRITPVTTNSDIQKLEDVFGIADAWPVVCEPFIQWVVEDDFKNGRPTLEQFGVQFVNDVEAYEQIKLSLLNAGHSVLGILGELLGYKTIDEAVNNPIIKTFLKRFMDKEVTPILNDVKGVNLKEYKTSLLQRFGNIYIKDQVDRICAESSAKLPIFLLPTVKAQLKSNQNIEFAAFVIAAWAIYCLEKDENGAQIQINDAAKAILIPQAMIAKATPKLFLELTSIFGRLKKDKLFVNAYTKAYESISENGIEKSALALFESENHDNSLHKIVCFGEVLWDIFPDHKKIGGAPLNVALRLKSLSNNVSIITRVGQDEEGEKIIAQIKNLGISTVNIQTDEKLKTGKVDVTLNNAGVASYNVKAPRAWDAIEINENIKKATQKSDAFIFGSLVARNQESRESLYELLKLATYKVFDVNLREPHYTEEVLLYLLNEANFIKFNYDEVFEIANLLNSDLQSLEENIIFIAEKTNTAAVCVTKGSFGAILYQNGTFYKNGGYKVVVEDTVGAGDSFLASLIDKLLKGETPQKAIDFATAVGAIVASNEGANPKIIAKEIKEIMK